MKLPHLFHRDPNWQQRGGYVYDQCKCGARRVRRVWTRGQFWCAPIDPGWPKLVDRHGRSINDTGWVKPGAEHPRGGHVARPPYERGGHASADVTIDQLPPPPEAFMQRPDQLR